MSIKKVDQIVKENIDVGIKTSKQILISSEEAPNFAMRKFTIEPGGSIPLHTNNVEHEQYVLNGTAEVQIGGKSYIIKKDDVVFIPANIEHNYKTIGNESFEFLCLVPNEEDKITIIIDQ